MIGLLCFVLDVLTSPFKSKLRLEAENAVLRHQLIVLKRRLHGRVRLTNGDRLFFLCYSAWGPDADRHDKTLIHLILEGSCLGAYSHDAIRTRSRVRGQIVLWNHF
jgi:hypothetical protein